MRASILNNVEDGYESTTSSRTAVLRDGAALAGRAALALIFLWSGGDKAMHLQETVAYMNAYHLPLAHLLVWPALLLEIVGGAMLLAGWKAREVALLLAAYSIVAALIFHNFWTVPPDQIANQTIHFMKNVAFAGGLLYVFAFGTGRHALERS